MQHETFNPAAWLTLWRDAGGTWNDRLLYGGGEGMDQRRLMWAALPEEHQESVLRHLTSNTAMLTMPAWSRLKRSQYPYRNCGLTPDIAIQTRDGGAEVWQNERYIVWVERNIDHSALLRAAPGMGMITIMPRADGPVLGKSWTDFQKIKNQIFGPECEAVELYPAESRLVNGNDMYHLFVLSSPDHRFPFGPHSRAVRPGWENQTAGAA